MFFVKALLMLDSVCSSKLYLELGLWRVSREWTALRIVEMEITNEDAVVLSDVSDGKKPRLGLRAARLLRDKLDCLIQQLSAENGNVNHRVHNMIPQSSNREDVIEDGGPCRDAVVGEATCEHSCACHEFVMNPNIWSNLAKELLQLLQKLMMGKCLHAFLEE